MLVQKKVLLGTYVRREKEVLPVGEALLDDPNLDMTQLLVDTGHGPVSGQRSKRSTSRTCVSGNKRKLRDLIAQMVHPNPDFRPSSYELLGKLGSILQASNRPRNITLTTKLSNIEATAKNTHNLAKGLNSSSEIPAPISESKKDSKGNSKINNLGESRVTRSQSVASEKKEARTGMLTRQKSGRIINEKDEKQAEPMRSRLRKTGSNNRALNRNAKQTVKFPTCVEDSSQKALCKKTVLRRASTIKKQVISVLQNSRKKLADAKEDNVLSSSKVTFGSIENLHPTQLVQGMDVNTRNDAAVLTDFEKAELATIKNEAESNRTSPFHQTPGDCVGMKFLIDTTWGLNEEEKCALMSESKDEVKTILNLKKYVNKPKKGNRIENRSPPVPQHITNFDEQDEGAEVDMEPEIMFSKDNDSSDPPGFDSGYQSKKRSRLVSLPKAEVTLENCDQTNPSNTNMHRAEESAIAAPGTDDAADSEMEHRTTSRGVQQLHEKVKKSTFSPPIVGTSFDSNPTIHTSPFRRRHIGLKAQICKHKTHEYDEAIENHHVAMLPSLNDKQDFKKNEIEHVKPRLEVPCTPCVVVQSKVGLRQNPHLVAVKKRWRYLVLDEPSTPAPHTEKKISCSDARTDRGVLEPSATASCKSKVTEKPCEIDLDVKPENQMSRHFQTQVANFNQNKATKISHASSPVEKLGGNRFALPKASIPLPKVSFKTTDLRWSEKAIQQKQLEESNPTCDVNKTEGTDEAHQCAISPILPSRTLNRRNRLRPFQPNQPGAAIDLSQRCQRTIPKQSPSHKNIQDNRCLGRSDETNITTSDVRHSNQRLENTGSLFQVGSNSSTFAPPSKDARQSLLAQHAQQVAAYWMNPLAKNSFMPQMSIDKGEMLNENLLQDCDKKRADRVSSVPIQRVDDLVRDITESRIRTRNHKVLDGGVRGTKKTRGAESCIPMIDLTLDDEDDDDIIPTKSTSRKRKSQFCPQVPDSSIKRKRVQQTSETKLGKQTSAHVHVIEYGSPKPGLGLEKTHSDTIPEQTHGLSRTDRDRTSRFQQNCFSSQTNLQKIGTGNRIAPKNQTNFQAQSSRLDLQTSRDLHSHSFRHQMSSRTRQSNDHVRSASSELVTTYNSNAASTSSHSPYKVSRSTEPQTSVFSPHLSPLAHLTRECLSRQSVSSNYANGTPLCDGVHLKRAGSSVSPPGLIYCGGPSVLHQDPYRSPPHLLQMNTTLKHRTLQQQLLMNHLDCTSCKNPSCPSCLFAKDSLSSLPVNQLSVASSFLPSQLQRAMTTPIYPVQYVGDPLQGVVSLNHYAGQRQAQGIIAEFPYQVQRSKPIMHMP